jgi:hypothetical protein
LLPGSGGPYGAVMIAPLRLTVSFDARDPGRLARFWSGLLGRDVVEDAAGALLPGEGPQLGLRFGPGPARVAGSSHPLHLHLTSTTLADQQHTVETALTLGASHLAVGQRPEEGHIVLADPEGNPFCVIEPGNSFLAGCGFLAEVACSGTREVGHFWSQALGWPLVWDQDGETAIQSPDGGTKVAWGGPRVPPKEVPNPQLFDLTTGGDPQAQVNRLLTLGATRVDGGGDNSVVLADPDGNEFWLRGSGPTP